MEASQKVKLTLALARDHPSARIAVPNNLHQPRALNNSSRQGKHTQLFTSQYSLEPRGYDTLCSVS